MSGIEGAPGPKRIKACSLPSMSPHVVGDPGTQLGDYSREGYMPHAQSTAEGWAEVASWRRGCGAEGKFSNSYRREGRGEDGRQCQAGTPACAKAPACETAGLGLDEEPRTQLV